MCTAGSLIFLLVALVNDADGSLSITVSKELTNDGFTFSCVLSPGPFTTLVIFSNPASAQIGGCTVPVSSTTSGSCTSNTSPASTVTQDMATNTTTIDIPAGYITGTTGLTGDWKCTHGSDEATVTYSNILAFNQDGVSFTSHTSGKLSAKDVRSITFRMDCLYPSATYDIEYLDNDDGDKVIYTQTLSSSACKNVAASCAIADSNAFGQDCTFSLDERKLVSNTKIRIKAKITGMQTTNYPTIVSNFIIEKSGLSPGAIAGIVIAAVEIIAAVVLAILWRMKLLCFKEPGLRCCDKAGIVIAVLVGVVVLPAAVIIILWKMKKLCFKVPTEEKPTGSTDSGIRSTSPNQVKPSVENSTPMVESSNVTNSKVDATENSKDPILDIENKKRHTGVDPLTERSEGQPEINKNKPLPSIGQ